ncbi:hypothetical protein SBOR_6919 [Sclerotinia borealis F-4128]|uniref:Reverse transcriptase Ty1/copia-type domain-containing protein n=1 Tax=Sclerotinia borealis (strain F-4128) TaxID=1432307 RepID=W9C7G0_SCLBF|nr:hypothetical protein SBOR_6919 [Sclerotinia borealis F-4128]
MSEHSQENEQSKLEYYAAKKKYRNWTIVDKDPNADIDEINEYTLYKCIQYNEENVIDIDLAELVYYDFGQFTLEDISVIDRHLLQQIRQTLRYRGLCIAPGPDIATAIFNATRTSKYTRWTEAQIKDFIKNNPELDPKFRSGICTHMIYTDFEQQPASPSLPGNPAKSIASPERYYNELPSGSIKFRSTAVKPFYEKPENPGKKQEIEQEARTPAPLRRPLSTPQVIIQQQQQLPQPQVSPPTIQPHMQLRSHARSNLSNIINIDQIDQVKINQIDQIDQIQIDQINQIVQGPQLSIFCQDKTDEEEHIDYTDETFFGSAQEIPSIYVESRRKEINGLIENSVFKTVPLSEVPKGIRIFNSRFVDEIKNEGTDKAYPKSRLIVQAFKDQNKTLAYVQSTTDLSRLFYIRPPAEIDIGPNFIFQIIRPLYGVPEAGNHWFNTYHNHHISKLGMAQSTYNPCLMYTKDRAKNGFGIVGLQTDDTLIVGDTLFLTQEQEQLESAKFLAKNREQLTENTPVKFNGGIITLEKDEIYLNQEKQCDNLRLVTVKEADIHGTKGKVRRSATPRDQYVAHRARGAYIASVYQPEASFDLSVAAQIVHPKEKDTKALNKHSLKLIVFTDASFANNQDLSSQIGYVIALVDKDNNANIIHWSSIKCKRVTRSVLASEVYGLTFGFDSGAAIKGTITAILQLEKPIPLVVCTDSKSAYDLLTKLGTTSEKRLMIDIISLRESYEYREITEVKWIDGESNPADAMTKGKPCQALRGLIDDNKVRIKVTEWVERE